MRQNVRIAVAVLLALAVASPVWAGTAEDPEIDHGCGGSDFYVEDGDERVEVDTQRPGRVDIDKVWFDDADGGVDVTMQVCDDVGEPGFTLPRYSVAWSLDEGCRGRVQLQTLYYVWPQMPEWYAIFSHECRSVGPTPLLASWEYQERVVPADRLTIDGPRITWHIRAEDVGPAQAATLEPGTVWAAPSASAQETWGWFASGRLADSITYSTGWRRDFTGTGRDFVVADH